MPWWNDFRWSARGVVVKQTGAVVRFDRALAKDLLQWFPYYFAEMARTVFTKSTFTVAFLPASPRPWYLLWGVNRRAGGKIIKDPHKADAVFFFEDKTRSRIPRRPNPLAPGFNFFCPDISKSNVAKIFAQVFSYNLAVNPETFNGPMAVKSEHNGAHDGRVVQAPAIPELRMTYQRLIDNEMQDGFVVDFRCPTVKGEIPLVYVKVRPKDQRFANMNTSVAMVDPAEVFSSAELEDISHFCSEIGLDWGGIDVLRDKSDGRIYIVDVNKTDMGPPLALPLKDKLRSTDILAKAFKEAIIDQPGLIPRGKPTTRDLSDIPMRIGT